MLDGAVGPTVDLPTPDGAVRGLVTPTPDGVAYAFLGIPYASGAERFRAGRPVEPWDGVRDATAVAPSSPQRTEKGADPGALDESACLNLNVWTPDPVAQDLPVLVWIHGGLHIAGSNADALCDGARLAVHGRVIVVAINYRLGAFGYLTLDHLLGEEYRDSGNLALVDAIHALQWVCASIASYGGDPSNVTIVGQSAGAVMAACLLAAPKAEGLFRRAILQSGSPERPAPRTYGESVTADFLDLLGIADDPAHLLDLPWPAIVDAQERLLIQRSAGLPNVVPVFRPSIDDRLLHRTPVDAVAAGASSAVDVIIGTNVNEATGFVDIRAADSPELRAVLEERLRALLPAWIHVGSRFDAYRDALVRDLGHDVTLAEMLESCLADLIYRQPSQRLLDARQDATASTRTYLFTWERPDTQWARRAGHSLKLPFLFRHIDDSDQAIAEVGAEAPTIIRDALSARWASFAATGNPGSDWPKYDQNAPATMVVDKRLRVDNSPREHVRRLVARAQPDFRSPLCDLRVQEVPCSKQP